MGLREDLRQTARGTSESTKSLISSGKARLKSLKTSKLQSKQRPPSIKDLFRRNDPRVKAKVIQSKMAHIQRRIKSGEATLEEKLKYRKLKSALKQIPIQTGIFAAQLGAGAVNPLLYPLGTVASAVSAGTAILTSGSDSSNKRLVNRVKSGKTLSPLERYKVKRANKLR